MKQAWRSFLAPLTPGVRALLVLLTATYVIAVAGIFTRTYNLYPSLGLTGPAFWTGKVWQLITYALLPATLVDFLINWLVIFCLGSWLERVWSWRQFWFFCALAAVGTGAARVLILPSSPRMMVGTAPIAFAVTAAWGLLFSQEKVLLWFLWETTVRQAAILLILICALIMLPCAGLINVSIMLLAALIGWLYVRVSAALTRARPGRTVISERMGRLEI
jgi:membrane associated rhomboid family serine protease